MDLFLSFISISIFVHLLSKSSTILLITPASSRQFPWWLALPFPCSRLSCSRKLYSWWSSSWRSSSRRLWKLVWLLCSTFCRVKASIRASDVAMRSYSPPLGGGNGGVNGLFWTSGFGLGWRICFGWDLLCRLAWLLEHVFITIADFFSWETNIVPTDGTKLLRQFSV